MEKNKISAEAMRCLAMLSILASTACGESDTGARVDEPKPSPGAAPTASNATQTSPFISLSDDLQRYLFRRLEETNERYTRELAFDSTNSQEELEELADRIGRDFSSSLGFEPHVAKISELRQSPLHDVPDAELRTVTFTNYHGLRVQGILSLPVRGDGPYPVMLLPTGTAGSAFHMFGIDRPSEQYHDVGLGFAADYVVFAVELPPTELDEQHFRANDQTFLLANAAGLNWQYFQLCDKVSSALDFLETVPAADRKRVGIYGLSSGGASAIAAARCDDRIRAVAASGTNVFSRLVPYLLRGRGSWYPHLWGHGIASRPDYYQVMLSLFPRTVIMELNRGDTTGDLKHALENTNRILEYYRLRGAPDQARRIVLDLDCGHCMGVAEVKAAFDEAFGV